MDTSTLDIAAWTFNGTVLLVAAGLFWIIWHASKPSKR